MVGWIAVGGIAGLLWLAGLTACARGGPVLRRQLTEGPAYPGPGEFGLAVAGGWHSPFRHLGEQPGEGGEGGRASGLRRP